ncbi:MAG: LacI family DNA-binding transcriptional regulator [Anaerolineae bacterium]|nr:LacI family transcriptional regulator [Thermoflexales bacterium]MDW8395887.1 LacI family DNA-binding transcriptional regulator [Anaerolineae bacterium]
MARHPASGSVEGSTPGTAPRRRKASSARKVTIADIARQAGVSKTAVSFAFNMPGRLSEETTRHILEIARRMGYTPNPIARSLNTRLTHALGVIVPQDIPTVLSNPFFAELLSGIGEVCNEAGMSLLLVPPMRGSLVEATYTALVDGCIVTGLEPDDKAVRALRLRQIPFVMIDVDAPEDISSVSVDDTGGAYSAMRHVLEQGHRRVAIVSFSSFTGRIEDYTGTLKRRFAGYLRALAEFGLSLDSPGVTVLESPCNIRGGAEALERLLHHRPRPTAVVALSDVLAFGIVDAALSHGLRVPDEIAVVGFDDLEISRLLRPALTTVRQPTREKGRRAAELFVEMMNAEAPPPARHIVLPVSLVVRESSVRVLHRA